MKNYIKYVTIIVIGFAVLCFAFAVDLVSAYTPTQSTWLSNGPTILYSTSTVQVGIGTSSPSIVYGLDIGTTTLIHGAIVQDTNATSTLSGGINILGGCIQVGSSCIGANTGTVVSGTAGQVAYYASTGTSVSGTSTIFINTSKDVGINTPSPTDSLDVTGSMYTSTFLGVNVPISTISGNTWTAGFESPSGTQNVVSLVRPANTLNNFLQFVPNGGNTSSNVNWTMGMNSNSDNFAFSDYNGSSVIQRFILTDSGNMGIGTTSPYRTLSVTGSSDLGNNALAGYFTGTSTNTSTLAGLLSIKPVELSGGTNALTLDTTASNFSAGGSILNFNQGGVNQAFIQGSEGAAGTNPYLLTSIAGGSANTTLTKTGLGIATSTPGTKLDVNGDITDEAAIPHVSTGSSIAIVCYTTGGKLGYITIASLLGVTPVCSAN